ncbi:MAG: recombination mediator RecR [Candidatus Nomurabacteria bacterium]|jgi:recombination protein RecR|nr:recombination mediator RecR [Candidatus Nomurabacteria bacterium]
MLPQALENVVNAIGRLPGVGSRTAERYAYFLLKSDPKVAKTLAKSLDSLHAGIKTCPKTFALISSDETLSSLYTDPTRDKSVVLVVEEPLDIIAIEKTHSFQGTYHVLGGVLSPIDGVEPKDLHIKELLKRVVDDVVHEIIIATNASVEGESTAIFLQKAIRKGNQAVKVSRLARGIPIGVDLEYTDQITLTHALNGRTNYE